jgi:hypothetical protein
LIWYRISEPFERRIRSTHRKRAFRPMEAL